MPSDSPLAALQRDFAAFLLNGDPTIHGVLRSDLPAGRLAVYRNTVMGSLAAVLGHAHPSLRGVLGSERFVRLACRFAAQAPPDRAALWSYGEGFADWLGTMPDAGPDGPVPPWAADLARLDWAMHAALFAADADPLDPGRLAAVPPERAGALRLIPHPSVRLVRSGWSVHALWADPASSPRPEPEAVLIGRAATTEGGEVRCVRLGPGDGALAARLLAGSPLDEAVSEVAMETGAGADLQALLVLLLGNRLLVGFTLDPPRAAHPGKLAEGMGTAAQSTHVGGRRPE